MDHWVQAGAPAVKRQTQQGTACTFAFLAAAVAILSTMVGQYVATNDVASAALVPLATLPDVLPLRVQTLTLAVTYEDGDAGACDTRRASGVLTVTGLTGVMTRIDARYASSSSGCAVRWDFDGAAVAATGAALSFSQPAWLMQHATWSLTTSSGLPSGPSALAGALVAPSAATRLNGTSSVAVGVTGTLTLDTAGATMSYGIVLALGGVTIGSDTAGVITASDVVVLEIDLSVRAQSLLMAP